MRFMLPLLLLIVAPARGGDPAGPGRHLPAECVPTPGARELPAAVRDREWNRRYRAGYDAIEAGRLEEALASACSALELSIDSPARDWRYAETLDELGLIQYRRGDMSASARAQGMAAAEVLLARGPGAQEVATYLARLALPLEELGEPERAARLASRPHRVLLEGFVPLDEALAERLDWLIAEYLRLEDLAAAGDLQSLVDGIEGEGSAAAGRER